MQVHGNVKLVPSTRLLLVRRVLEESWKVAEVAAAQGVSERTVYRWLARFRAGDQRLSDRSSAPRRVPRRTPQAVEVLIERLRRLRMTSTRIAAELGMAVSTVGAVLARLGLNRLSRLEPPEPANRYERRHPGELVHLDIKRLSRFVRPGWRLTGHGVPGSRGQLRQGWEFVHVAVDDYSRVAYVEILHDERGQTCVGFLEPRSPGSLNEVSNSSGSSPTTAPATAQRPSPRPVPAIRSARCAPGPTDPAPTEKQNNSSRRCCTTGPTRSVTRPATNATWPSHPGSSTTTNDDHTAPSVTRPPTHGSPPHDQRAWDLHLDGAPSRCSDWAVGSGGRSADD